MSTSKTKQHPPNPEAQIGKIYVGSSKMNYDKHKLKPENIKNHIDKDNRKIPDGRLVNAESIEIHTPSTNVWSKELSPYSMNYSEFVTYQTEDFIKAMKEYRTRQLAKYDKIYILLQMHRKYNPDDLFGENYLP